MDTNPLTFAAWSYGTALVGYAAFGLHMATSRAFGPMRRMLAVAAGVSAAWASLVLGFALTGAPLLLAAGAFADLLRETVWFAFLLVAIRGARTGTSGQAASKAVSLAAAGAGLIAAGILAQLLATFGLATLGPPRRLLLLDSVALSVFGLVLVEQLFRNASADSRWNVKPLCIGLGGAFLFDLYLFSDALLFNRYDVDAFSVRGFVHAVVIPLILISVIRSGNGNLRIALSQRVVFHSAALVASGLYLLFMAAAGYYVRYFGGEWGRAIQLALLFAGLLLLGLLALSESMRAKLRVQVNKHFFSYRYDYREVWLRFTRALSAQGASHEMGLRVVRGLADLVESPAGALWLKDGAGRSYAQAACWNMAATSVTESADGVFPRFLLDSGWVVNLEEYRSSPARYEGLELPTWLSATGSVWLVVPLVNDDDLIGFVLLATARTALDVNWEVNDLLKTAGRQAAGFLGQMRATEALLEARKFDAFNRMSAFVVHDLKNIVAQLSLMTRNAERHRDNPEFQQDMLMTVDHAVERMKQLMMQLREGTTPVDAPRGVDLGEIVQRIQAVKTSQESAIEVQMTDRALVRGHPDRLERVIGHVVQNALDATNGGGRVWIRLERASGQASVEVGDTGHGMTPEFVRERLFKPFQTTKQSGMGIGAYESHQYVQELGGRILVDSTPGVGTRVRLLLPLFEPGVADEAKAAA